MLKDELSRELNTQINEELFSSYLYLSMAAWFADKNLPGFERWMKIQAQEELSHAMKFYTYICERGNAVTLDAIAQPGREWSSPRAAFEAALQHERHITSRIDGLMTLAMDHRDYATQSFLQWFVTEQVEEEATADGIVRRLELAGDAPQALLMVDQELSSRPLPPSPLEEGV